MFINFYKNFRTEDKYFSLQQTERLNQKVDERHHHHSHHHVNSEDKNCKLFSPSFLFWSETATDDETRWKLWRNKKKVQWSNESTEEWKKRSKNKFLRSSIMSKSWLSDKQRVTKLKQNWISFFMLSSCYISRCLTTV